MKTAIKGKVQRATDDYKFSSRKRGTRDVLVQGISVIRLACKAYNSMHIGSVCKEVDVWEYPALK